MIKTLYSRTEPDFIDEYIIGLRNHESQSKGSSSNKRQRS